MKYTMMALVLLLGGLFIPSCTPEGDSQAKAAGSGDKVRIVVTAFPEYDWLRQILGDQAERFDIKMLLENGGDLHNFEPSVADITKIASANLFVYNGGVSDAWVKDVIAQSANKDLRSLALMQGIGNRAQAETLVEGMQQTASHHCDTCDCQHEHGHASEHEHEHAHSSEAHGHASEHEHDDEHIWLSLKNAVLLCDLLEEEISALDPAHADEYEKNKQAYIRQLQALDAHFTQAVKDAPVRPLIIADRFPFIYMMTDYQLPYYAAFQGCSAETEASFETISFLSQKVDETKAHTIFILEGGLKPLAQTIIANSQQADCQVQVLNSIQSVSPQAIEKGETYLMMMEDNFKALQSALEEKK